MFDIERDLTAVGSLTDPTRRAVYEFVSHARRAVGRDEVADAIGIARQTAAYHLDRLAEEGLVDVGFARLSGRTGPGAGRPAKTYARSERDYSVTVPPRRYLVAARIMLEAIRSGAIGREDLASAAHAIGVEMGSEGLETALDEMGYEPAEEEGEVRFLNCPFHAMVEDDRETTCNLNLALVKGMVEGAADPRQPCLGPEEGYCCVRLRSS
ncbi:MAG TPA: helix-turn-helix domain-containing protein [Acidimicrobiia bacterium]|nr:helix-turn-helix domain-containing protein [Acidimicrobiia bacterium]